MARFFHNFSQVSTELPLAKCKKEASACPFCKSTKDFGYKQICAIRLYREIRGRKVFQAQCQDCRRLFEVDGGKATLYDW